MPNDMSRLLPGAYALTRRRFVQGLALGSAGLSAGPLLAAVPAPPGQGVLRGNHFELRIDERPVNYTGTVRPATLINGSLPAPTLRWHEGESVTLQVTNRLRETTSIHWHGIILPAAMDGVPGISYPGIAPGETFTYRFRVQQSGTYWYHSHSGFQEQSGLYGALVIDPREPEPFTYQRDYVVMLSDWTDQAPDDVYATLKKLSHYYNINERTAADLWSEIQAKGVAATWRDRQMWNRMRMSDRDLSDVTGYTYTFLMNGQTPADGWVGLFRRGERVRLRFINGSAMTFFDVRIPGLKMTVIAADGQPVEPVSVDEFRLGVAETLDVLVEPADDRAYTLFAQAIDRTGYARGTLTPDPALRAEVPPLDPLPVLGHRDMGMAHGDHGSMPMDGGAPHSMETPGGHGAGHADPGPGAHGDLHQGAMAGSPAMEELDMSGMQLGPDSGGMPADPMTAVDPAGQGMHGAAPGAVSRSIEHAPTEYGPHVDMRADNPGYRLDDPGVGLRNNGRRVLTYADLRYRHPTADRRAPEREIELHLTGNMSRYMWSINGIKFADAAPLPFRYGERLRITFVNDTMMNHPMHLHGMWSELETGDPDHLPRKHTVVVQPGAMISFQVTADAPGDWAFHCHLLYHMPGMFRRVSVR